MAHVDLFSLKTSRDLLSKLEHHYARLIAASPTGRDAQFAAFDFFVCVEHLPDWLKAEGRGTKEALREYGDAPLVSHIANGAKHFELTNAKHTSLAKADVTESAFQTNAFQSSAFQTHGVLFVETSNGKRETLVTIAERVLAHWRATV